LGLGTMRKSHGYAIQALREVQAHAGGAPWVPPRNARVERALTAPPGLDGYLTAAPSGQFAVVRSCAASSPEPVAEGIWAARAAQRLVPDAHQRGEDQLQHLLDSSGSVHCQPPSGGLEAGRTTYSGVTTRPLSAHLTGVAEISSIAIPHERPHQHRAHLQPRARLADLGCSRPRGVGPGACRARQQGRQARQGLQAARSRRARRPSRCSTTSTASTRTRSAISASSSRMSARLI
jgi:hypothetical protein